MYVVLAAGVFGIWLCPIRIEGISMTPTLISGQLALVDRLAYRFRAPARGDIVWIRGGTRGSRVYYVKRVIGLSGETLEFRDGRLTADGLPVREPYTNPNADWWMRARVPAGSYYVVGDNRTMPPEDHYQGLVDRRRIVGKVRWWWKVAR